MLQVMKGHNTAIAVLNIEGTSKGSVEMKGRSREGQESCNDLNA